MVGAQIDRQSLSYIHPDSYIQTEAIAVQQGSQARSRSDIYSFDDH